MNLADWKTTKVPRELHAVIKARAAQEGISLTDLIEIILLDWLRRQGIPAPGAQSREGMRRDLFLEGMKDEETTQ